jgi:hypothetical protein
MLSLSKKCFRHAEQVFLNPKKFRKTYDLNGAGRPSWVPSPRQVPPPSGGCAPKRACGRSRAHPSFPLSELLVFFDSLNSVVPVIYAVKPADIIREERDVRER